MKIGVIAGRGEIPFLLKKHLEKKKTSHFFLGLKGFCDEKICDKILSVGQLGGAIKTLKKEKVSHVIFIGGMDRPSLDNIKVDFGGGLFLLKNAVKIKGDDSLLSSLANLFEKKGFEVIGVQEIMSDILVKKKNYTKKKPSSKESKTIQYGFDLAKKIGEMDVGQAVVVQGSLCLGLEGIEGTNELIKRCAKLKRGKTKPILVKVSKPKQDRRVDMPTIGISTIREIIKGGFTGVVVEAGGTLFPEKEKTIELANKNGVFIKGI